MYGHHLKLEHYIEYYEQAFLFGWRWHHKYGRNYVRHDC